MAFNDSSYGLFQGQLFGATRVMNGAQTGGYLSFGDADKFELSPKQKFDDIEESQTGLGLTSAHIPVSTQLSCKVQLLDIKFSNLEKAVWGTYGGTVSGSTVTDEAIKLYPGAYCPLQHPGVSAVTLSAGVLDTDYTIDSVNGGIQVLSTTTVFTDPDGTDATADYTFAAYGGRVQAFTTQQPIFMLRLNGVNTANPGQPVIINVFQWAPDMTKMLSMIAKKHIEFELDGMMLQDTSRPLPTPEAPFSQFFEIVKG